MTYTADQLELLAHLEEGRARAKAWVAEDPQNRFAGYSPVDLDWHAENGVFSVADLELAEMKATYSDAHKDAYGFRPRNDTSGWTREDWERESARVSDAAQEAAELEREEQDRAIEAFEQTVQEYIDLGAGDRETALRWIRDAEQDEIDRMYGDENLEYQLNLPYGYIKRSMQAAA